MRCYERSSVQLQVNRSPMVCILLAHLLAAYGLMTSQTFGPSFKYEVMKPSYATVEQMEEFHESDYLSFIQVENETFGTPNFGFVVQHLFRNEALPQSSDLRSTVPLWVQEQEDSDEKEVRCKYSINCAIATDAYRKMKMRHSVRCNITSHWNVLVCFNYCFVLLA